MSAYEQAQRTLDACRTPDPEGAGESLPLAVQATAIAEAQVYATLALADELHALQALVASAMSPPRIGDMRPRLRVEVHTP